MTTATTKKKPKSKKRASGKLATKTQPKFELSTETITQHREDIRRLNAEIIGHQSSALRKAREAGALLVELRRHVRANRKELGNWEDWAPKFVGLTSRTISSYMKVFKMWALVEPRIATIPDEGRSVRTALLICRQVEAEEKGISLTPKSKTPKPTPKYSKDKIGSILELHGIGMATNAFLKMLREEMGIAV